MYTRKNGSKIQSLRGETNGGREHVQTSNFCTFVLPSPFLYFLLLLPPSLVRDGRDMGVIRHHQNIPPRDSQPFPARFDHFKHQNEGTFHTCEKGLSFSPLPFLPSPLHRLSPSPFSDRGAVPLSTHLPMGV
jgi:hypothetical protein